MQIVASVLYLAPLYLLPKAIILWAGGREIRPLWTGALSGLAIGGYLVLTAYLLFGKVFLSDLMFQLHLIVSAFVVAALDKFGFVAELEAGREGPLIAVISVVQILLYGCVGALIGWVVQLRQIGKAGVAS